MICFRKLLIILAGTIILSGCATKHKHESFESEELKSEALKGGTHKCGYNKPAIEEFSTAEQQNIAEIDKSIEKISRSANSYSLNANKSLDVAISDNGYTRFYIEDERITDVFVYPQESIQVHIHKQGYLIIVPTETDNSEDIKENIEEYNAENIEENIEENKAEPVKSKIYVTITGEQGTTQDLSLRFTGKAPEPVSFFKNHGDN